MVDDSAPSQPLVWLDNVQLGLPGAAGMVDILRGIDLAIDKGEIVGIVGPSGSGKSTMMMVIGGLERASSGVVRVKGHDLSAMDEDMLAEFRRREIGIVFQDFHLVPTMNALENVALPLEFAGRSDAFDLARDGLAAVGLSHRLDHFPGQLSGGEQQRVAIARAFVGQPDLLLADEPTGNLDGETGKHVIDLLFSTAREKGATLMLITHDPELAARCDRVLRLVDGRIVDDRIVNDQPVLGKRDNA